MKYNHDPEFLSKFDASMKAAGKITSSPSSLDLAILKTRSPNHDYSIKNSIVEQVSSSSHPYHLPCHSDHSWGKPLTSIPGSYLKDVLNYVGYLSDTACRTFKIYGKNLTTGEETVKEIPYVHRWTLTYRNGFLAKMYQLQSYMAEMDLSSSLFSECTMITFTGGSHRGKTIEEVLSLIKAHWKKFHDVLYRKFGAIDYFRAFEPHKSGFPHLHVFYMKRFTKDQMSHLRSLWAFKYGLGTKRQGINFRSVRESSDGSFSSGSIKKMRGYVMKYVGKSMFPDPSDPDYDYTFGERHYKLKYSPKQLLFNSILKKTKTRLWNASRNFSKVMARPKKDNSNWECTSVSQMRGDDLVNVIWDKESGFHPSTVKIKRLFGRYPAVLCKTVRTAFFLYTHNEERAKERGWKYDVKGLETDVYYPFPHYLIGTEFPSYSYSELDGDFVNVFEEVTVPVDAL